MRAILLLVVGLSGCTARGEFLCALDEECALDGVAGRCEPSGGCSFPDDGCASGWRYGEGAAATLAGRCVPAEGEVADAGADDAALPPPADAALPPPADAALPPADAATSPPDAALPPPDAAVDITVVLSATADSWIDSMNPTTSHGGEISLRVDGDPLRLGLVRFDLSSLPAGAVVQSAALVLTTTTDGGLAAGTTRVFRLLEAWNEGGATWQNRTPGQAWATAGAGVPGSRDPVVQAVLTPAADDTPYTVTLPAALVQGWLAAPAQNHGVILVTLGAGTESVYFVTREGAAGKRPTLVVTYLP